MQPSYLILVIAVLALIAFARGHSKSARAMGGKGTPRWHSLASYHGYYAAAWCAIPAVLMLLLYLMGNHALINAAVSASLPASVQELPPEERQLLMGEIVSIATLGNIGGTGDPVLLAGAERYNQLTARARQLITALCVALAMIGALLALRRIAPTFRARNKVEDIVRWFLVGSSTLAILTTIGIFLSVIFEAVRFFGKVPITEFMFGLEWSPQTSIRSDQVGSSGSFGAIPLFAGTMLISSIAMIVAVPLGLMTAIYLSEYASPRFRGFAKPALEVLAGIPTVVYGFFAALTVGPILRSFGDSIGLDVASESALGAGLVMGIMIIPFISSLSDDVINAVPQAMRDGSYGLGATRSETIKKVVLPAALPGIVGGILLAASRAIGETMIVVMAAGLSANLTANPFEAVTTVTVQIVTLLVGDQEFDSAKTLAAFALGLMLFLITLILNVIALRVVRRYREQYD
ncbi:MAG: phosphate ABC transporter permease subunit PstC [Gammaproteobacteria bacterium]